MMDLKDLGGKIAAAAPGLGALLGSVVPGIGTAAGGALGMGIKALASIFGLAPDSSPDQIAAAIEQDPQAALKLRLAEMDYEAKKRDQELAELKTYLEDAQSARNMNIEGMKATGKRDTNLYALSWVLTIGFFLSLIAFFIFSVPEANKTLLLYLVVTLQNGALLCWSFWYGSSKDAGRMTELLARAEPIRGAK
jgi:hypothetical protein